MHTNKYDIEWRGILVSLMICLLIGTIIFVLWNSMADFIKGKSNRDRSFLKEKAFSIELFYALVILYSTIMIGFALIYFTFAYHGIVLLQHDEVKEVSGIESFIQSIYFSGVTLLTVGYGDVIPMGIGRVVALIQAIIGHLLPAAFVFRLIMTRPKENE